MTLLAVTDLLNSVAGGAISVDRVLFGYLYPMPTVPLIYCMPLITFGTVGLLTCQLVNIALCFDRCIDLYYTRIKSQIFKTCCPLLAVAPSTLAAWQNGRHFWLLTYNNLFNLRCERVCGELSSQITHSLLNATQTVDSNELTYCSASHVSTYVWKASWVLLTALIAALMIFSTVMLTVKVRSLLSVSPNNQSTAKKQQINNQVGEEWPHASAQISFRKKRQRHC